MKTFSDELRDAVEDKGLSINAIHKATGIDRNTIGRWLNQGCNTSARNLHLIAQALGKEIRVCEPA